MPFTYVIVFGAGVYQYTPPWSRITTPLEWSEWEEALKSHPDQQYRAYIVTGLREGFRVGFDYAHHSCQSTTRDMHSAREHAQVIQVYLAVECSAGRVVGPLCPLTTVVTNDADQPFWSDTEGSNRQVEANFGPFLARGSQCQLWYRQRAVLP